MTPSPLTGQGGALVAVSAGGALGAFARYGLGLAGTFPWTTFAINVTGCLLIGALIVAVTERPGTHPLVRPFLGTGFLGGYTTFSTYTVDVHVLVGAGRIPEAVAYLLGTLVAALTATWLGMRIARAVQR
jgi:CrcB protein